jgi:hypothetical protein
VAVVLGAWKLAMTMVAVLTVDKIGRRPLLLGGVAAMTASLLALSAATASGSVGHVATATAVSSVLALLLYVGAYQVCVCMSVGIPAV